MQNVVRLDRWSVNAEHRAAREVSVPSPAVPLGWKGWDESTWETVWTWTTHFELQSVAPYAELEIGAALGHVVVLVNGVEVGSGESGFLPCYLDVAAWLRTGANTITIIEDARWRMVPPMGSPLGAQDVDFFLPAGIHRPVRLRLGEIATLRGISVRSAGLLTQDPVVTVTVPVSVGLRQDAVASVRVVRDADGDVLGEICGPVAVGETEVVMTFRPGDRIALWAPEHPVLYHVEARIEDRGGERAAATLRTGFREISWDREGMLLNGAARRIIGLNRHELFPFVGFAASDRAQRNDARILKEDVGVDFVRCSHYPPSEAFLDACDELGLLVFEEAPGWQYAGTVQRDPVYDDPWLPVPLSDRDADFERAHVDQFRRMVERDRHRPSVAIWGAFLNETRAFTPDLWQSVIAEARALDCDRVVGGATRYRREGHETGHFDSAHDEARRKVWPFDVFGYNDYHLGPDDEPQFLPPVDDYPYLVTEAIGQMPHFREWFTRGERSGGLARQALFHAAAIEHAFADGVLGMIGWVAFDYPSPHGAPWGSGEPGLGPRGRALKTPGVADVFRIPKPAAAIYRAQRSPSEGIVLEAAFAWESTPDDEPLRFASNCEELVVTIDGNAPVTLQPDRVQFPRTPHPLFVLEHGIPGATELHAIGRIGARDVTELRLTRDTSADRLRVRADDARILGDGVDTTRVWFQVSDTYGNLRSTASGAVQIRLTGPGALVGPDVLDLPASAGAVWVRSVPDTTGIIQLHLSHPTAGSDTASITVSPAP